MFKAVNVASSKFVSFTEPRLEKRYQILTSIIQDDEADDAEIVDAAQARREVKECLDMFKMCRDAGLDTEDMTACDIIETITEKPIEYFQKNTPGGRLAEDIMERSSVVMSKTKQATKKKVHSFAGWLAELTGDEN